MKNFVLLAALVAAATCYAAPMFPQCPAVGVNTGCQFLITINANNSVTITSDPNAPNNQPYDASDDTLVGIVNNSTRVVTAVPLSSAQDIFGFEDDGPCSQTPAPGSCPSTAGFPGDTTGYGGPGVTYSSNSSTHGVVHFNPGIQPGGSAWFGLEGSLTSGDIVVPGPPTTTPGGVPPGAVTPEPATMGMAAIGGFAMLLALRKRRQ